MRPSWIRRMVTPLILGLVPAITTPDTSVARSALHPGIAPLTTSISLVVATTPRVSRFTLCVPASLPAPNAAVQRDLAIVGARLTALGVTGGSVVRIGTRCIDVDLPSLPHPASVIKQVSRRDTWLWLIVAIAPSAFAH